MSLKKIALVVSMVGKKFEADFTVTDVDTSLPIVSAVVTVQGQSAVNTNASGLAVIGGLKAGTYTYTVTHPDYDTVTSSFTAV